MIRGVSAGPLVRTYSDATGLGDMAFRTYLHAPREKLPTPLSGIGRLTALGSVERPDQHVHFRTFRLGGGSPPASDRPKRPEADSDRGQWSSLRRV